MAKIKVSRELRDVLAINNSIIANLKASKARSDKMLDKYRQMVEQEMNLPSNRYLDWSKIVHPYTDAVISSMVNDYELLKRYENFIKQLVEIEQQNLVRSEEVETSRYNFDRLLNNLFRLERKHVEARQKMESTILRLRLQAIKKHAATGNVSGPSLCQYCGNHIDPEMIGIEAECTECALVPDHLKDKYTMANQGHAAPAEIRLKKSVSQPRETHIKQSDLEPEEPDAEEEMISELPDTETSPEIDEELTPDGDKNQEGETDTTDDDEPEQEEEDRGDDEIVWADEEEGMPEGQEVEEETDQAEQEEPDSQEVEEIPAPPKAPEPPKPQVRKPNIVVLDEPVVLLKQDTKDFARDFLNKVEQGGKPASTNLELKERFRKLSEQIAQRNAKGGQAKK